MQIKNLQQNIIFAIVISMLFILIETNFRLNNSTLLNMIKASDYITVLALFTMFSFLSNTLSKIILTLISMLFIIEIGHFNYFGYFIFPMEFILFFTKSNEVYETLITKLDVLIEPLTYSLILVVGIFYTNKITRDRVRSTKINYIVLLFLIIPIVNTSIHYKKRALGERPNTDKSIVKNSLYVTKAFFGKTLPLELLDIQIVPKYTIANTFDRNDSNKIDNVILIIGESLSSHFMSLYGYDKPTTKELQELSATDDNFVIKKALSAGVYTDASIPMILHIAKKPNAIDHILSNRTNLFKLAKENQFKTYWISAQANDGFSYIRSYMGLKYIDSYTDSSNVGFDRFTSGHDDMLYNRLKKIDLENHKNFVVLNMIGSHSPYETRVPEDFKPFGSSNPLQHYENSVAYTDKTVADIIRYIKNNTNSKTLVIFTSDHGQSVSASGYGHGNISNPRHFEVPLVFYSNNFKLDDGIQHIVDGPAFVSHYNMALICAYYLGYDTLKYADTEKAFINGNQLSGNGGFVEYTLSDGSFIIK